MHKSIFRMALLFIAVLIPLTSCKTQTIINETTEEAQASSVIDDVIPSVAETSTEETATVTDDITIATSTEKTTEKTNKQTTTEEKTTETQPKENETVIIETEVDLSLTLPEANGKMYVDKNSANKYTSKIAEQENISTDLLVAVYTIPENDQNYVFEFYSADYSANNIRRVFLLDTSCKITGVAADKAGERKDMTVAENWFCMNVLIRGVIFPELKEQFK